ncbi:SH3 domain-containing protein, partial [Cutibacterium acnes]
MNDEVITYKHLQRHSNFGTIKDRVELFEFILEIFLEGYNDSVIYVSEADKFGSSMKLDIAFSHPHKNLYRIENSGKLLGYANDGDIAELWENSKPTPAKTFTIGVNEGIVLRNGAPSLSAAVYGVWPKYSQFKYDSVHIADGYVFLGGS